jgi:acyl-CoA synthetase (AMP-forming)/AMP-acid ligase II
MNCLLWHTPFRSLGRRLQPTPLTPILLPQSVQNYNRRPYMSTPRAVLDSRNQLLIVINSKSTGLHNVSRRTYIHILAHQVSIAGLRGYANVTSPRRVGAMALPPFHAFGLVTQLYAPLSCLSTTVVYPPRTVDPHAQPVIPTSDNILECVRETKCHHLMIVPTFLEQMVTSEEAIEALKNVEFVVRSMLCTSIPFAGTECL